jgi:predicted MFS family arabinose efflux permease
VRTGAIDRGCSSAFGRALQLLLLTSAAGAGIYTRTAVGPLQEAIRSALSLSDNQMALLQGPAMALPLMLGAVPLGLMVDRYSRSHLLLIATVLELAGTVATALSTSFMLLLAARCLVGLAAPTTAVTAYSLLADLYGASQRGRATMIVMLGQVGGSSVAFALGGTLLSSSSADADGWREALLLMATLLVPVVLLTSGLREPPRKDRATGGSTIRDAWPELRRYRVFIVALVTGMALVNLADGAVLVWAAPVLSRSFGLTPDRVGTTMAMALLVGGVAGPIGGGFLADKCQRSSGPRGTLTALSILALLSVPTGCFAAMSQVTQVSLLLAVFLLIGSAINVLVTAISIVVIPNELRGLCMALEFAAGALFGLGLAPLIVSTLAEAIGGEAGLGRALSIVCATTGVLGTAMFAYARALPLSVGGAKLSGRDQNAEPV